MTAFEAYGYIVLSSAATAAIVWVVCWRYWHAKPLTDHTAYILGWDACSRVRDREEAQERKARLLNERTSQVAPPVVSQVSSANHLPRHQYTDWCTCEVCRNARSATAPRS